jgi:hypothetical protein
MSRACRRRDRVGFLNVGDLVWFNSGGSTHRALVLGFTLNTWLDHSKEQRMVKVYWLNGIGPRPSMYDAEGRRIYAGRRDHVGECFVAIKSRSGMPVFKVISKA